MEGIPSIRSPERATPGKGRFGPGSLRFSLKTGLLFLMLFVLLSPWGWSQDDHGDTPAEATLILTNGTPVAGNIDPAGDLDYFKFPAVDGNLFTIETSNLGSGSDTYLILFDSDGYTRIAEDDQGGEEPNASRIVFSATQSDVYFVEVSQFFLSGTGTYDLTVTDEGPAPPDDHGNSAQTATLIQSGSPVTGVFEIPLDVDFFAFVPQTGSFYDIETSDLSADCDTYMILYDSDGETPLAADDQGGRDLNASRILWPAPQITSYYVSISHFLSSGVGSYSLQVTDLGEPRSATPDGTLLPGTIPLPGDVDVFSFETSPGHQYRLAVTDGAVGGFQITVRGPDGITEIMESPFGNPELVFLAAQAALHFALVSEEISGGDYLFSVEDLGLIPPNADFDYDGWVDESDLYLFMKEWHSPSATPTPGP